MKTPCFRPDISLILFINQHYKCVERKSKRERNRQTQKKWRQKRKEERKRKLDKFYIFIF